MYYGKEYPDCKHKHCQMNEDGRCTVLISTDFNGRFCPFFKKKEGAKNYDK